MSEDASSSRSGLMSAEQPRPQVRAMALTCVSPPSAKSRRGVLAASGALLQTLCALFATVVLLAGGTCLAQSADVESARLDRSEAPGRETARLQKEADETRVSAEKARPGNKAGFKP